MCVGVMEDPTPKHCVSVNYWIIGTEEHNPAWRGYAYMVFAVGKFWIFDGEHYFWICVHCFTNP